MGYVEDLRARSRATAGLAGALPRPVRPGTGQELHPQGGRGAVPGQCGGCQAPGAHVDPAAGKVAFSEWAERWYNTTAALRHTTRRDYRKLLDQQVLPAFDAGSLAGIDALAVREWVPGWSLVGYRHGGRAGPCSAPSGARLGGGRWPAEPQGGRWHQAAQGAAHRDALPRRRAGRGLGRGDRPSVCDADSLRRLLGAAAQRVDGAQGRPPGSEPSVDQRPSHSPKLLVAEAEEVGFEPTGPSRVRRLSRSLPSASSATPPRVVYGGGGGIRLPGDLH
jgi:hypothetical protein